MNKVKLNGYIIINESIQIIPLLMYKKVKNAIDRKSIKDEKYLKILSIDIIIVKYNSLLFIN